jgi:putative transposase
VLHFLVLAILVALKPKALLVAENLCLRQQLLVLERRRPQARLHNADRQFWICASRWFAGWRNSLLIVKPETVLRWHRTVRFWRRDRDGNPV